MILMRPRMVPWCSRAMGAMAACSTPSMRYLTIHRVVERLNVNVGGAALEGGEDGGVDQADDGADVLGLAGELLDRDVFVGVVVAGEHVEGEPFAGFVENALRLLGFLQQVGDLRKRGHARLDALPEQAGDLVEHHQPRRVADRNHQASALCSIGTKL